MHPQYRASINRVLDYIENHLDEDLNLNVLSDVGCFSPYHFHRLFRSIVGETISGFVQRIRLERGANQLLNNKTKSITHIALDCGFANSAAFSRAFKKHFRCSPSEWRKKGIEILSKMRIEDSNAGHVDSKSGKADIEISSYFNSQTNQFTWRCSMTSKLTCDVRVKEMPDRTVAYARHIGPYKGNSQLFEDLFTKVMKWAGPRGLLNFPETEVLSIYHDDPNVTEEEKLRTSAGISVPPNTKGNGDIGIMTLPGGMFAVARFEIDTDQYEEAWGLVYGSWLPESGYQPDDRLCYELNLNNPKEHPQGKHIVDICIPVKPL